MLRLKRRAHATWQGTVPDGGGRLGVGSGAFEGPFTLKARMGDEPATNPEELIGAAHAGCYTMSLASLLEESGHPAINLETKATVVLEQLESGFSITRIELATTGEVEGVDEAGFRALAEQAEKACPVSRALAGTEIVVQARLAG